MVSHSDWERLKEICLAALEMPPAERGAYLDEACDGDATLREEVESLLAQHDPDFLEEPLVSLGPLDDGLSDDVPIEARTIGPYRIVRPLGRGGMGEVFLAIQEGEGFERPVAIKLIRPGMASDDVLERFRLERRILATLEHPNLARLIDGGATEDGRPYFVMEHIEGVPITEFCDTRALSVDRRLELFLAVCDAVRHAHQSLVVHRDLKPSNILVTADGVPKLLDFGIGKVLDASGPDADRTAMTRRVLTPEYAAPEQVRGGAITTATDVHGLGVLLYELLTGSHPFRAGTTTAEELDRALLESTPSSPSTAVTRGGDESSGEAPTPSRVAELRGTAPAALRRRLRGDLDNIVLKALRKDPTRRYSSAEAMRADVGRHLRGLPVLARPDSFGYRASKFVARNPWGVAAACLALIAAGIAIVLPARQSRRLAAERDKAVEVQSFLLEAFGTTGGDETIGARDLLDLQASRVDSLYADRPELRAQMLRVLADAYDRLGLYADAAPLALQSLEAERGLRSGDHPDLATALNAAGWAVHRSGDSEGGVPYLDEAVAMRRRLGRGVRRELARSLNDLGVVRAELEDPAAAALLHREALEIRRQVLGDTDRATGVSASNLAAALYGLGDLEGAAQEAGLALELLRRSVGPDHQRTIIVQNNLATFKLVAGDVESASEEYRDLLARQMRLQGAEHPVTNGMRLSLANTLERLERYGEAELLLSEAIRVARSRGEAGLDRELSGLSLLSDVLRGLGRPEEAERIANDAIPIAERERSGRRIVYSLYYDRFASRRALGDLNGAANDYVRLVEIDKGELRDDPDGLGRLHLFLAGFMHDAGRHQEADSIVELVRVSADTTGAFQATTLERLGELEQLGDSLRVMR